MEVTSGGMTKNIFKIMDPMDGKKGKDAEYRAVTGARGGMICSVQGPNREVFDSRYLDMNEFWGLHQITVKWYSEALTSNEEGLILEYWKRDSSGTESLAGTPIYINKATDISDNWGQGVTHAIFSENYQYRILIKSGGDVAENEWVGVDQITLHPVDQWSIINGMIVASSSILSVGFLFGTTVTVTGNNTNYYYTTIYDLGYEPTAIYAVANCPSAGRFAGVNYHTLNNVSVFVADSERANWTGSVNVDLLMLIYKDAVKL